MDSIGWWLGIALVSVLLLAYICTWISARKVAGTYRFVRQEQRVSPPDDVASAQEAVNRTSMLVIKLGILSTEVIRYVAGSVDARYTGDLPFWYKAELTADSPTEFSYDLEYIPYKGGYPNIVMTERDKDGQFLKKWIYTLDAPKRPVVLDTRK